MQSESQSKPLKPPINLKEWAQTLENLRTLWTTLSPKQQELAAEKIQEIRQARERNPLQFLIPNGKQAEAIREVGNLENFIILMAFANGVGKTSILAAILGAVMWGAPTTAFDYPLYNKYPDRWPKRIRIVSESELVGDMGPIQTETTKWWPKGRYQWSKGGKTYNRLFHTDTGFFGEVMTYEQAVKEFEGKTTGINCFIEPPPKLIFNASTARQRKGGLNIMDMTPLMSAAWVLDDIVSKPVVVMDGVEIGRAKVIHADIEDNCAEHGKNGQLLHSDILQLISRYDPDEIDARAHGQFMHLSGRILKGFDRSVHVMDRPEPAECIRLMVCDPAIAKPLALIWAWADAAGSVHIYDEHPEFEFHNAKDSNLTVTEYANQIIKPTEEGKTIARRILDRHFGNVRRTLGGKTLREEFSEVGLDFEDSYVMAPDVEVETGILKIKEYLRYDKAKPLDNLNRPRLTISPKCKNVIAALERSSRSPDTGKQNDDGYKDFFDDVRMLVMAEPKYEPSVAWSHRRGTHYGVNNA